MASSEEEQLMEKKVRTNRPKFLGLSVSPLDQEYVCSYGEKKPSELEKLRPFCRIQSPMPKLSSQCLAVIKSENYDKHVPSFFFFFS